MPNRIPHTLGECPRTMYHFNVFHPGGCDWIDEWKEWMVGGILCNPVYAGIPLFEL